MGNVTPMALQLALSSFATNGDTPCMDMDTGNSQTFETAVQHYEFDTFAFSGSSCSDPLHLGVYGPVRNLQPPKTTRGQSAFSRCRGESGLEWGTELFYLSASSSEHCIPRDPAS